MLIRPHNIIVLFLILPLSCQQGNTTDKIDIRDDDHKITKYVAVILIVIFLLYGFICNILMAMVLFYSRKSNHYSYSFVLIISQLIFCNILSFVPTMLLLLPKTLQSRDNPYGKLFYLYVLLTTYFSSEQVFSMKYHKRELELLLKIVNRLDSNLALRKIQ